MSTEALDTGEPTLFAFILSGGGERQFADLLQYHLRRSSKRSLQEAVVSEAHILSKLLDIDGLRFAMLYCDHLNTNYVNRGEQAQLLFAGTCWDALCFFAFDVTEFSKDTPFKGIADITSDWDKILLCVPSTEMQREAQSVLFSVFQIAVLHFTYIALLDRRFRKFLGISRGVFGLVASLNASLLGSALWTCILAAAMIVVAHALRAVINFLRH